MMDDDDLPLLTHVLRTADGHAPSTLPRSGHLGHDDFDFDIHAFDETPPADPRIVIGNDGAPATRDATGADGARSEGAAAIGSPADAPIVADPRHQAPDAFRLVQDVDDHGAPPPMPIDEPAFVPSRTSLGLDAAAPDVDGSIDFSLPTVAERVREAVLERVSQRIDTELDARIAQAIHAEVETALAQLQHSLRLHLGDALRDVVAKAVDEEVARIGATRPGLH